LASPARFSRSARKPRQSGGIRDYVAAVTAIWLRSRTKVASRDRRAPNGSSGLDRACPVRRPQLDAELVVLAFRLSNAGCVVTGRELSIVFSALSGAAGSMGSLIPRLAGAAVMLAGAQMVSATIFASPGISGAVSLHAPWPWLRCPWGVAPRHGPRGWCGGDFRSRRAFGRVERWSAGT
jgi:hypothetical protein